MMEPVAGFGAYVDGSARQRAANNDATLTGCGYMSLARAFLVRAPDYPKTNGENGGRPGEAVGRVDVALSE